MKIKLFTFCVMLFSAAYANAQPFPNMTITPLTKNHYVVTSYGYPGIVSGFENDLTKV